MGRGSNLPADRSLAVSAADTALEVERSSLDRFDDHQRFEEASRRRLFREIWAIAEQPDEEAFEEFEFGPLQIAALLDEQLATERADLAVLLCGSSEPTLRETLHAVGRLCTLNATMFVDEAEAFCRAACEQALVETLENVRRGSMPPRLLYLVREIHGELTSAIASQLDQHLRALTPAQRFECLCPRQSGLRSLGSEILNSYGGLDQLPWPSDEGMLYTAFNSALRIGETQILDRSYLLAYLVKSLWPESREAVLALQVTSETLRNTQSYLGMWKH